MLLTEFEKLIKSCDEDLEIEAVSWKFLKEADSPQPLVNSAYGLDRYYKNGEKPTLADVYDYVKRFSFGESMNARIDLTADTISGIRFYSVDHVDTVRPFTCGGVPSLALIASAVLLCDSVSYKHNGDFVLNAPSSFFTETWSFEPKGDAAKLNIKPNALFFDLPRSTFTVGIGAGLSLYGCHVFVDHKYIPSGAFSRITGYEKSTFDLKLRDKEAPINFRKELDSLRGLNGRN